MRIAVIADTHDRLPSTVVAAITGADQIWHLGDVCAPETLAPLRAHGMPPLTIVRGNCDSSDDWPMTADLEVAGQRLRLIHIPPPKVPDGFAMVLHGHTHVPRYQRVGSTLYLNPGCITRPNRGAPASFAWLDLEAGKPPQWRVERV